MKSLLLTLSIIGATTTAGANCPTSANASVEQAYSAMALNSYWMDLKGGKQTGKNYLVGIVFLGKNDPGGLGNVKSLYPHWGGIFKIDYTTTAKAKKECRRQILLDGNAKSGKFTGWLAIESCDPTTNRTELVKKLNKAKKFKGKKLSFQPSVNDPQRVLIKISSLSFKRVDDKNFGPSCQMDIEMATRIGGSAKSYSWKLPDNFVTPRPESQLTYFRNNGSRVGYSPHK